MSALEKLREEAHKRDMKLRSILKMWDERALRDIIMDAYYSKDSMIALIMDNDLLGDEADDIIREYEKKHGAALMRESLQHDPCLNPEFDLQGRCVLCGRDFSKEIDELRSIGAAA